MTRQERINQIMRELYALAPYTLRDALGGHTYCGTVQPPNKWDQNMVLHWVKERWNG